MPTPNKPPIAALDALMSALNGEQEIEIVTKAEVDELLASRFAEFSKQITESLAGAVAETVAKALPAPDRDGVGRKGVVPTPEDERDADPAAYIVKKAAKPDELSQDDKELLMGIMFTHLKEGMRD